MNRPCRSCPSQRTKKNGTTTAGTQRYRCVACGKSFTLTDSRGRTKRADGMDPKVAYEYENWEKRRKSRRKSSADKSA